MLLWENTPARQTREYATTASLVRLQTRMRNHPWQCWLTRQQQHRRKVQCMWFVCGAPAARSVSDIMGFVHEDILWG